MALRRHSEQLTPIPEHAAGVNLGANLDEGTQTTELDEMGPLVGGVSGQDGSNQDKRSTRGIRGRLTFPWEVKKQTGYSDGAGTASGAAASIDRGAIATEEEEEDDTLLSRSSSNEYSRQGLLAAKPARRSTFAAMMSVHGGIQNPGGDFRYADDASPSRPARRPQPAARRRSWGECISDGIIGESLTDLITGRRD
ncbi:unnamed protein product [Vitrella brassicaformis CCMP3155]|uniref:Uncharacterized protein n=1 Tax=Vitrella brassicaformis (strain CCMP3155) TaxID=1169540 RepID=A0A0G4ECA2_VITBC|nr:unnamed protein product [Vitrella brassicaformis CCMP3155]|eukprot:CEL93560.1 unnamed protein product [Vitrella brassicaformis CCMP3155]